MVLLSPVYGEYLSIKPQIYTQWEAVFTRNKEIHGNQEEVSVYLNFHTCIKRKLPSFTV